MLQELSRWSLRGRRQRWWLRGSCCCSLGLGLGSLLLLLALEGFVSLSLQSLLLTELLQLRLLELQAGLALGSGLGEGAELCWLLPNLRDHLSQGFLPGPLSQLLPEALQELSPELLPQVGPVLLVLKPLLPLAPQVLES